MEQLKDAKWVAERVNLKVARVYELAREDRLPCVRFGRQYRFDPVQIEKYIADGGQGLSNA